jgi:hypothetical protein
MEADKLLTALSTEELLEVHDSLPAEFERRGIDIPSLAGTVAVEGAAQEPVNAEVEALDTKESITDQLSVAFSAYETVSEQLNEGRKKTDQLHVTTEESLAADLSEWLTDEKLAYVASAQEADPELCFTLVATPNTLASAKEIIAIAKAFGKDQPYSTYVWEELYARYTAEQLSGTNPQVDSSVVFSLIPSKLDPSLYGTVQKQQAELAKLQATNPDLKVSSVLEAITYWQTLRAQGSKLADHTTFDTTYIRHFDLPVQRVDVSRCVPFSSVFSGGSPYLYFSFAVSDDYVDFARVAVG